MILGKEVPDTVCPNCGSALLYDGQAGFCDWCEVRWPLFVDPPEAVECDELTDPEILALLADIERQMSAA